MIGFAVPNTTSAEFTSRDVQKKTKFELDSTVGQVHVTSLRSRAGFREFEEVAKRHSGGDQLHVKLPDILERLDASSVSGEYSENHKVKLKILTWPWDKSLLTTFKFSTSGQLRIIPWIHSSLAWQSERSTDFTYAPFLKRYLPNGTRM